MSLIRKIKHLFEKVNLIIIGNSDKVQSHNDSKQIRLEAK